MVEFEESGGEEVDELGDDGVAEPAQSVHPMGNPMSHSTQAGLRVEGGVFSPLVSSDGVAEVPEESGGVGAEEERRWRRVGRSSS